MSYILVTDENAFINMIDRLITEEYLVADLETSGLDEESDYIVGWVFAGIIDPNVYYVPVAHEVTFDNLTQLPAEFVAEHACRLIHRKPLVLQNYKFDFSFIRKLPQAVGIELIVRSDTMVESFVTGKFSKVGLKDVARDLYNADIQDIEDVYPVACEKRKTKTIVHFEKVPIELAYKYACDDGYYTRKIHNDIYPRLMSDVKLKMIYDIEMNVIPVADKLHKTGIRVDFEMCEHEYNRLMAAAEKINKDVHNWLKTYKGIDEHFDFGSSAQTAKLLIDKLGVVSEVLTEKGNRSTSKKNFEGLRYSIPIVNAIFTYRELVKSATGFYGIYPDFKKSDGRVHANLLTCHVLTGRTASADPNLQQISNTQTWVILDFADPSAENCADCTGGACERCEHVKKIEIATTVRDVFIPRDGYMFVEGDYSQIELVTLAGVSGEPRMLQAFRDGLDIHRQTAALIFRVDFNEVTPQQRQTGKTTNFRFNYGGGPVGLKDQLGISMREAKSIIQAYKAAYPMVDFFADKSAEVAAQRGYVETPFGRRRYMAEFSAVDPKERARGRRLAINVPIQGGAADIAKIGLIRQDIALNQLNVSTGYIFYLVNFVHDSYKWEVPIVSMDQKVQAEFVRQFCKKMTEALCFNVGAITGIKAFPQLNVDYKMGMSYGSLIKQEKWYELAEKGEAPLWAERIVACTKEDEPCCDIEDKVCMNATERGITLEYEILKATADDVENFKKLLKGNPGSNLFILRLDGQIIRLDNLRTSLSIDDKALINSILPGNLYVDGASINGLILQELDI